MSSISTIARMPNGSDRISALFAFCGESILPPLDGEKEIHSYIVGKIGEYHDAKEMTLKTRVEPLAGLYGVWQAVSAAMRGKSIEGEFEIHKIDLSRCTPADVEEILSNEDALNLLLLTSLSVFEKQWGRYQIRCDGETFLSHLELYDYLVRECKGDKKEAFKLLIFLSETVGSSTVENAYEAMGDISKGLMLTPRPLFAEVALDTKKKTITQSADYDLYQFDGEHRKRLTSFRLIHSVDLVRKTAHSIINSQPGSYFHKSREG